MVLGRLEYLVFYVRCSFSIKKPKCTIQSMVTKAVGFMAFLLAGYPLLHVLFSNFVFLLIFDPSRTFFEDILHHFSKKWYQNIFIVLGLYQMFNYYSLRFLRMDSSQKASVKPLVIKDGTSSYQVFPAEIEWIESAKNYVVISMLSGEQLIIRKTISAIFEVLKDHNFIQVSRSAIINKQLVHTIRKRTKYSYSIATKSAKIFPIGKTFLKNVRSSIEQI